VPDRDEPRGVHRGVHEWTDGALLTHLISTARESVLPPALDGVLGPDAVWEAVAVREHTSHQVVRLRLAGDGQYRLDQLAGGRPSGRETTARTGSASGWSGTARPPSGALRR
jgi:hypothetical protein